MKILYRYYRWRAGRAKTASGKAHYRHKAYKHSNTFNGKSFFGRDLTFEEDPWATRQEQTLEPPLKFPNRLALHTDDLAAPPGKYLVGRWQEPYYDEEKGELVDPNEWRETPAWWAGTEEANEQHMPTRRLTYRKPTSYRPRNDGSGRQDAYFYNYQTGQQEKI